MTFNFLMPILSTRLGLWMSPSYFASLLEHVNCYQKDFKICSPVGGVRQILALKPILHLAPLNCRVHNAEDNYSLENGSFISFGMI